MTAQLSLLDLPPLRNPQPAATIAERFDAFHRANPHVYAALVKLAREWKAAGHTRCGMKMLFEVLRYERGIRTSGEQYVMNNDFTAFFARLIMRECVDLRGFFEVRERTE